MQLMTQPSEMATSTTLLTRLRDITDADAWTDFVDRYSPAVFEWCRKNSLQDSDAADVTQQVLLKLVTTMRTFEYDQHRGSFRGWLKTVTANTVTDLARQWQRRNIRATGDTVTAEQLNSIADPSALNALSDQIEAQYRQELLKEAESRVKVRVQPATWDAWYGTAVGQDKVADVAAAVGMTVSEVYVAKSRVTKMMREEVQRMEAAEP